MDLSKDKFFSVFEGEELSILRQVAKDFRVEGDLKDRGEKEIIELLWRKWEEGKEYKSCISREKEIENVRAEKDKGDLGVREESLDVSMEGTKDSRVCLPCKDFVDPNVIKNPFRKGSKQFYAFECWRENPCREELTDRIRACLVKMGCPSKNVYGLWNNVRVKMKAAGFDFVKDKGILNLLPLG